MVNRKEIDLNYLSSELKVGYSLEKKFGTKKSILGHFDQCYSYRRASAGLALATLTA